MDDSDAPAFPLHITRALAAAEEACAAGEGPERSDACHAAALRLADAIIYYVGALAAAQYSQALYAGLASGSSADWKRGPRGAPGTRP